MKTSAWPCIAAAAGAVAGVMFNQCTHYLSYIRPKPRRKFARLAESALICIGTVALRFTLSHAAGTCVAQPAAWAVDEFGVRFLCPEGRALPCTSPLSMCSALLFTT